MDKIALFVVLAGVSLLGSIRAEAASRRLAIGGAVTHVGGLWLGGSGGHADTWRGGHGPFPPVPVTGGSGGGAVGNGAGGNVRPQVNCGHRKPQVR
jgi:hypothetical protein